MNNLPFDLLFEILIKTKYEDIASLCRINQQFATICQSERGKKIIQDKRRFRENRINEFLNRLHGVHLTLDELIDFKLDKFNNKVNKDIIKPTSEILSEKQINRYIELKFQAVITFLQQHQELYEKILHHLNNWYSRNTYKYRYFKQELRYSNSINKIINIFTEAIGPYYIASDIIIVLRYLFTHELRYDIDALEYEVDLQFLLLNYDLLPQIIKYLEPIILINQESTI